ncbi:MAG: hypothetical protein PF689_01455 [Deltaproteobacteria bacterium]|jgi:hypothetical protein|nr:hypothetical protein [Deltaproteobacteria bacterium]
MMKTKSFILLSLILSLGLLFAACDDDESNNNNNNNASCGNNEIEAEEVCDGTALSGESCSSLNPDTSGTLACKADCSGYDQDNCVIAECGNDIKDGSDQCDGVDLGLNDDNSPNTCQDIGDFSGGTLACNGDCTYDTSQCEVACNVEGSFEDCDPLAGENECCEINSMPSQCFTLPGSETSFCLQTCSVGPDCGWSMMCESGAGNLCYYPFCGSGNEGSPVREECIIDTGRDGYCYPLWRDMDDAGICFQNGTVAHEGTCDNSDVMGEVNVDADTQCDMGICAGNEGEAEGICHSYCNPLEVIEEGIDNCPADYNCINFSEIDLDETFEDGSPNPNQFFRTPDYGICYPSVDGVNTVIDTGLLACNLITNNQTKDASSLCPVDTACKYVSLGTLIGACQTVDASLLGEGEECVRPQAAEDNYQCAVGHECFIYDPFNDPDLENPYMGCNKLCDARNGYDENPDCAGITTDDASALPYVCLTTSRFFTPDMELPSTGSGLQAETESSPSKLGFCVAPPAVN